MNILKKKFYFPDTKPNVPKNDKIKMGWFTANNMVLLKKYLRNVCTKKSIVIEFGTWLGMSAKFICDNISDDSTLICVDWWKGDTSIGFITQEKEDLLYHRYIANVWNYRKKIIPVRMDGKKAAVYLSKLKIKPNLIYLDMGHSYEDVIADLNVIIKVFPNTIIVGDDYLYWPGVKKAVLEARYKFNIPYLNVDKNCYALLYNDHFKYMTYDNNEIGKNIDFYSNEELQYSTVVKYNNNKRVVVIPLSSNFNLDRVKPILKENKKDMFILVKSNKSIFSKYNFAYKWFMNNLKNKNQKNISFIFVDPNQFIELSNCKTTSGILSITNSINNNKETYTSLGTLSIDINTMKIIDNFPHNIDDIYVNRYLLFQKIIKNKLIIYQKFIKKNIGKLEIGHDKKNKQIMNKLKYVRNLLKKVFEFNEKNTNQRICVDNKNSRKITKKIYYIKY
tara:strand:- start:309 stop:1652 length:1344 start_codon:yes stop_codon:yes gene_type:complete